MSKELFVIFDPLPSDKFKIVGVCSISRDSGCKRKVFNQKEQQLFTDAWCNICLDNSRTSDEKSNAAKALISEFI